MVIGSSPIIYPMWSNLLKKSLKISNVGVVKHKLNSLTILSRIVNKYKTISINNIITNVRYFMRLRMSLSFLRENSLFLKNNYKNDRLSDLLIQYTNYISFLKNSTWSYFMEKSNKNNLTLIVNYKSQLHSTILKNLKVVINSTNGLFSKKLELEKCQKKHDKLSIINLKDSYTRLLALKLTKSDKNPAVIINIKQTTSKIFKFISFFKKKLQDKNTMMYFTPCVNYSQKKFKKIKSIKRKLTKKYNKLTKN